MLILILLTGLFLAFSNGANDNFKGVATLLGSKTTSYRIALIWATVTILLGSLAAFFLAQKLMSNFSGKGLVPEEIIQLSSFSVSVALAAALTVFMATRIGFPISTTHAITGALVGAGFMASASGINLEKLGTTFFMPLILSPVLAIIATSALYPALSLARKKLGVTRESCLCIGNEVIMKAPAGTVLGSGAALVQVECCPQVSVGTNVTCEERYIGQFWGVNAKSVIDASHFLSAGLVGFARGLNDTPKIAAVLLVGKMLDPMLSIALVALVMGLGGIIYAKKIAETMSYQITEMNDGQGLSANLITSFIVIGASHFGMPVSTTHVSCGALFGIGTVSKKANWKSIFKIVVAWVTTLPMAGLLGYICFALFRGNI